MIDLPILMLEKVAKVQNHQNSQNIHQFIGVSEDYYLSGKGFY